MALTFTFNDMPVMKPIKIPTQGKSFLYAVFIWLWKTRDWEIVEDWFFKIDETLYVIPKGTVVDGASIPKYFWAWISPTGILLIPAIVHDYLYSNRRLMLADRSMTAEMTQKECDKMFRDIAIDVNGLKFVNQIAYWALRLFGWFAWNSKRNK